MPFPICDDQEVIRIMETSRTISEACERAGVKDKRNFLRRIDRISENYGIPFELRQKETFSANRELYHLDHEYTAVLFGDEHFWPERLVPTSPAVWILLQVIEDLKPDVLISMGDSFDGFGISRHPPHGWAEGPSVEEELSANRLYLDMISGCAPDADRFHLWGNHDARFDSRLASQVSQFSGVKGMTLADHFPDWRWCEHLTLSDTLECWHSWHGGVHAAFNNTLKAGRSCATGHTHRCHIREWTDLNGTRYGIETGTLADPNGPQFFYVGHRPTNWQMGFAVVDVTSEGIHPERVIVDNGKARFRGRTWTA